MLSIGALARSTGTKVQTVRYYEQIGLMPQPDRTDGGQRRYREADRSRLGFIRHARQLGFTLGAIRALLDLSDDPTKSSADVVRIVRHQLVEVDARIGRLEALRTELDRILHECRGGTTGECRILEALHNHSACLTDHEAAS